MFQIKVCGLTTPKDAQVVVQEGADAVGLNFYPKSSRYIDETVAEAIEHSLGGATETDSFNEDSLDALSRQMQVDFREWAIEGYFCAVEQSLE